MMREQSKTDQIEAVDVGVHLTHDSNADRICFAIDAISGALPFLQRYLSLELKEHPALSDIRELTDSIISLTNASACLGDVLDWFREQDVPTIDLSKSVDK